MAITTLDPETRAEDFDGDSFNPHAYLQEYYDHIGSENLALLEFLAGAYAEFDDRSVRILEFGGGPTLYQHASAARVATEIVFTDYLQSNLDEVQAYIDRGENHFDWSEFVDKALEIELGRSPTVEEAETRLRLLQQAIAKLALGNVLEEDPVEGDNQQYDVVQSMFVAESITSNEASWRQALVNELSKLKPGGTYITAGLLGAKSWPAGDDEFPAFPLDRKTVVRTFKELGLDITSIKTIPAEHVTGEGTPNQGYEGMFFIKARKKK